MKFVEIDRSRDPIMVYKFTAKDPSVQEFDAYLKDLINDVHNMSNGIIISDLTHSKYLSSENRIKVGKALKTYEDLTVKNVKAFAYVVPSVVLNMVLKGIFAIKKPPVETKIFKTQAEAIKWSQEKIAMAAVA